MDADLGWCPSISRGTKLSASRPTIIVKIMSFFCFFGKSRIRLPLPRLFSLAEWGLGFPTDDPIKRTLV